MGKYRRLIIKRRSEKCRNCIHKIYGGSCGEDCYCGLDNAWDPIERKLNDPGCVNFSPIYCYKCKAWAVGYCLFSRLRKRKDGYSFGCESFILVDG